MNVAARLGLFVVAAALVFVAAFGIAAAMAPDGASERWQPGSGQTGSGQTGSGQHDGDSHDHIVGVAPTEGHR